METIVYTVLISVGISIIGGIIIVLIENKLDKRAKNKKEVDDLGTGPDWMP